jgi:maleate isomerase
MPDRFGPRGVFAVIIPQQNANMQPEYERMRPDGINNQMYRFDISDHDRVAEAVLKTVPTTLGCFPDMIITGNSIEMRNWSVDRQRQYCEQIAALTDGVPVVTATDATENALKTMGAKRIGIVSPMSEEYSKSVQEYYESAVEIEVPYASWLQVKESKDIINVSVEKILEAFKAIDHDDVDAFLHVGGALGITGMLEELEQKLGRPIVSSNAATYWYALRKHGITDPMPGFGQLLMRTEISG